MNTFQNSFANLMKARFPYVYIPTWEEHRVLKHIRSVAKDAKLITTDRELFTWGVTTGFVDDSDKADGQTRSPLSALEFIEKHDKPAIFVFKDFHAYFGGRGRQPDYELIRKIRDISIILRESPKPKNVVFISPTLQLPDELRTDITVLDFPLPDAKQIHALLEEMISINRQVGRIKFELEDEEKEKLVKAALGLTMQEAENAFARAMVEDGVLDASDVEVIHQEKRQIIKKTEILDFVDAHISIDDVGGLQNLKRWLSKRSNSWLDSAARYGLPAPKGILITGVPGCGKSLVAKAISSFWNLPLLRLDIGKIFSGLVGSSEENMRKSIKTVEAIAPAIFWIDEIEKGFAGTGAMGDSGTATRVFGTFLTWMQEKTKPVFVVATANNIQSLPPEFLRKGRFDEIFFVDLPTKEERKQIFNIHLAKRLKDKDVIGDFKLTKDFLDVLSDQTEGFVGAEVEETVVGALFEAYSENRSIRQGDFLKSISSLVPLSVTQAEQIRAIREWANVRAVAATSQDDRVDYIDKKQKAKDDIAATRGGRAVDF